MQRFSKFPTEATPLCGLALVSLCLFAASQSVRYGDSLVYTSDILRGALIEPGHLMWRPLGYVVGLATGSSGLFSSVMWRLQWMSLAASVLSVIATYLAASRVCARPCAFLLALLMAISNGFWDYSFSGCSYSMSVLFGTIALGFAVAERDASLTARAAWAAGICAGLAASAWTIQVIAVPGIWLALLLTPSQAEGPYAARVRATLRFGTGFALAFAAPLLLAYAIQRHTAASSFQAWFSSSSHGIPPHFGIAQTLRMAMGWPQSVMSISNLGARLRLWNLHETGFPVSMWIVTLIVFYAAIAGAIRVLAKAFPTLDTRDRGIVIAGTTTLAINLLFAAFWQGTDLERYFPSWPFQLLLAGLTLDRLARHQSPTRFLAAGVVVLAGLAAVNWLGTLAPVLGPHSYRRSWIEQLQANTTANDLVLMFGQSPTLIEAPHLPELPRIENVSTDIVMHGSQWQAVVLRNIDKTHARGGRIFLTDSLFGTGSAPRDGWSFKEFPSPPPAQLQSVLLPFKTDRVAFVVNGERVWLGMN